MCQYTQRWSSTKMRKIAGSTRKTCLPYVRLLLVLTDRQFASAAVGHRVDIGVPKQGTKSVGVQYQHSGTLDKIANCQAAVNAALWTGVRARLLGVELYPPEPWLTPRAASGPTFPRESLSGKVCFLPVRVTPCERPNATSTAR